MPKVIPRRDVYALLAQRMGLMTLKSELEFTSFRILYPWQHNAVTALTKEGEERSVEWC